jgi:hypothetical protein
LFATIAGEMSFTDLTPASGRQDHTASPSARDVIRPLTCRVHRIPPRVRDDREPPSVGRDGKTYAGDLGQKGTGIFLQRGLDSTCKSPGSISRLQKQEDLILRAWCRSSNFVMAGLRPGHPRLHSAIKKDVDARDKRGHDGVSAA